MTKVCGPREKMSTRSTSPRRSQRLLLRLNLIHIKTFTLPEQEEKLVLDTAGVIALGKELAERWLEHQ